MELKQIPVEELQLGMYVSKLDRPWTETPFVFQGFILRSQKQIDAMKKYCKHVFVDPEKEDLSDIEGQAGLTAASIRGTTVYKDSASLDVELPRARTAIAETTNVLRQISRDVQVGHNVDGPKVRQAAADITESVVRNPDAATLLVQLQEKSGETFNRAIHVSVMMSIFGRFLQLPLERWSSSACSGCCRTRASSSCRPRCWKSASRSAPKRWPCTRRTSIIRSRS